MVFDKKEYMKEYNKMYREKNREKILRQKEKYRQNNKEKISQQKKEWNQTPEGIKSQRISKWKYRNVIHYDWDLLHDVIYTLTSHCDYCGVYLTTDKKLTPTTKCLHHLHISNVKDNVEAIVCHSCNIKAG